MPAPDLRFTPDSVDLAPGAQASVLVTVEPAADLRGATLDLPGVQDGVTSSFQAAADGAGGMLTITASQALEAGERALDVHGRSGVDSSKAWVGKLTIKAGASPTAKTVFVDAVNGKDSNSGSQSSPLKTIKQAFTKVVAGDTVKLLPGSYTKNGSGDVYPLQVPQGVTLVGTLASSGAKRSSLSPESSAAGTPGLTFAGDATVKDLELDVFGSALQATKGTQSLSNLNSIANRVTIDLKGTAQATLTNAYIFIGSQNIGVNITDQAKFTMDSGTMEASSNCSPSGAGIRATTSSTITTAQVTLKNGATLRNIPGAALQLDGKAKATLNKATITRANSANCVFTNPSVDMRDSTSLTADGATITMQGGQFTTGIHGPIAGNVTVKNTIISGHTAAGINFAGNGLLTVEGCTITANAIGIDADSLGLPHIKINASKIESNGIGIDVNAPELFIGNTSLSRNGTGIFIKGSFGQSGAVIALGGFTGTGVPSTGNNVIRDNTNTGVDFRGASGNLFAQGNTWNASTQGADAQGHYATGTVVRSSEKNKDGLNFMLRESNSTISL